MYTGSVCIWARNAEERALLIMYPRMTSQEANGALHMHKPRGEPMIVLRIVILSFRAYVIVVTTCVLLL